MRQLLGPRKLRYYARITGLPIVKGTARGGTNHRVNLGTSDGRWFYYWPDGTLEEYDNPSTVERTP